MTADRIAYTIQEAAEVIGVSPDTIRRAIRDGDIEARYLTRRPSIHRDELQRWFDSAPTAPFRRRSA